ncbi:hypothetical protein ACFWWC_41175 [Streptomyces sp. NPDC058642]|uniref:hypothetical protein n=1 Tax=Streptomyces sp. NPDC058642 TaxID=3346572 RepID=UPI00365E221D
MSARKTTTNSTCVTTLTMAMSFVPFAMIAMNRTLPPGDHQQHPECETGLLV